MKRTLVVLAAVMLLLSGCGKKRKHVPVRAAAPIAMEEEGIASWYGNPYHGRQAANGEIYDMDKLTAAHRTLPFGTMVRVENLSNNRSVEVRITDRGPFVDGRIIDLSRAAAKEIQVIGPGTAKVRLHVVSLPPVNPAAYFAVQAGAFRERANAEKKRDEMAGVYGQARLVRRDGNPPMWRVVVGHTTGIEDAQALARKISSTGDAFVVRVDGPGEN